MLLIVVPFFATALANPVLIKAPQKDRIIYGNAVDLYQPTSIITWKDLASYGYEIAFVSRKWAIHCNIIAYTNSEQGMFDNNSITNIQTARIAAAGMMVEVYMTPQPTSIKTIGKQLMETYTGLAEAGIKTRTIWLQVVTPQLWHAQSTRNVENIESYIKTITSMGLRGGIYTSFDDWNAITANWTGAKELMLWYTDVLAAGFPYDTSMNFDGFQSFGGWTMPSVKQYSQNISLSGAYPVCRDVFSNGRFV